jgi:hypothetical protein
MTTTKPVGQAHTQAIIPLKTAKNPNFAYKHQSGNNMHKKIKLNF